MKTNSDYSFFSVLNRANLTRQFPTSPGRVKIRFRKIAQLTGICLLIWMGIAANSSQALEIKCDMSLPIPKNDPYSYQLRGDRCEGIFIKEVSSTTLTIASFLKHFDFFDPNSTIPLNLSWDKPEGANIITLRAQSLKHRLYYRMDTMRSDGVDSYSWPTNVLSALIQSPKELGVVGATKLPVAGKERDVLLPLNVGYQSIEGAQQKGYHLVVVPGLALQELFVSIYQIDTNGQIKRALKKDVPLQYGYYPANRGIDIPVTGLDTSGIYLLELSARFSSGGSAATELWFYHVGPS